MPRPRLLLLALLAACAAVAPLRADDEVALQRYLASLYLGDVIEDIQRIYPPAREWTSYVEPRGHVKRMKVDGENAKSMPVGVETMWLGLKHGRLVEIQLIYDAVFTRKRSVEDLAEQLSLLYGDPKRSGGKYWWKDGSTVLRCYYQEVPVVGGGVELRTTLQLMESSLFHRR